MKTNYINGLSKVMLGLYGAAIIFGPPSVAQMIADACSSGAARPGVTKAIWGVGTLYVFCVCPFVMSAATRKWRSLLVQIIEK